MLRPCALSASVLLMICGDAAATSEAASDLAHYPVRPVHLVVPYPAGGGADHWARIVSQELSEKLGQPIVVDNIPGAGGNIGTAAAAHASADGYTLLLGSVGPLTVHPYTYTSLEFDPEKAFTPIALLESSPVLLVEGSKVGASSAAALIDSIRAEPGKLSYASNGNGSPEQVAGEIFKKRLQLDIRHIPYGGAGPARKAVLANEASLMFDPCKGAIDAIRDGRQKPLAVAAPKRLSILPDVPTFGEIGVPNYDLRVWTGVLAPTGTPEAIIVKLNKAIQATLQSPQVVKEIIAEGGEAGATSPNDFRAYIQAEHKHWSALVAESGIPKVQ